MKKSLVDYGSPIYDPFRNPSCDDFIPDNSEAQVITHISHIIRDIHTLFSIVHRLQNSSEKKLLEKYIYIEWLSLDENILQFAQTLLSSKTEISISNDENATIKVLYKAYKNTRKPIIDQITKIRNKLGAHRDQIHVSDIAVLWESINSNDLIDVLNCAVEFFNYAKGLNIYSWFKVQNTPEGEIVAFVNPLFTLFD